MSKYFYRFMIIVLFAFLGISILGSGQVFASGSSFNVPHVNDHFEKVQQGPAPTKEAPVTPTPQKEKEHGDGNWLSKAWNWTKETVSSAWNKTKEVCSEAWDWICNVCDQITKVVVDGLSSAWDWIKENIVTIGVTIGLIVLVIVAVVLIVAGGEFVLGAVVISGASLAEGILTGIVISGLFSWLTGNDFLGPEMLSDMLFGGLSGGIGGVVGSYATSSIAGSGFVSWLGSKISWLGEAFPKIFGGAVGSGTGQTFFDWFKTGKVNFRNTVVATIFGGLFAFTSWSISEHSGSILSKITDIPIPTLEVRVLEASGSGYKIPSISFGKITVGDTEFGTWLQKFASNGDDITGTNKDSVTGKVFKTRPLDSKVDADIINRVKELRAALPSKYKKSGNFAIAEVHVSGISKTEFYAHSSIDELTGTLSERVPDISLKPKNPIFKAYPAPNKNGDIFLRDSDTEYKILNDIAARLGDNTKATGEIKLFTELDTCASCSRVIAEFAKKYPNIKLDIVHNNGNRIIK
ncbi:deaminase domain-containing protein [Thermoactinomyces sp. FSL K6-2592]|jgi:hypothetical protein|uniref:deaminase domain-containing protein n=1 Tax=Thermoactinomyces sp. FSL K6-2592 TaxID=2975347 RepID=UPI0030FD209C